MTPIQMERGPLEGGRNEIYCDLIFDGATPRKRRLIAPHTEENAFVEIFGRPEYPVPEKLAPLVSGLPVLDLGSHVGSAAAYFEEALLPSRLICYEPNPICQEYLKKNVPNAEVHKKAISNAAGVTQFFVRVPMYMSGMFENGSPREVWEAEVVTGIEAIQGIEGEIGVIKVDCESSELNILYSMRSEISRARLIFVEYHNEDIRRALDVILRDFVLFHSRTCGEALTWGQGTVGYVRRDVLKGVPT